MSHVTWVMSELGGGIPPVVASLSRAQRALGLEPAVVGVADPAAREPVDPGLVRLARPFGPRALGFAPGLPSLLRASAPEVVHLHGLFTWPSWAVERFGRRTRTPVVIAPHGMLEPWALAHSRWKKQLFLLAVEQRNLSSAACFHALNRAEAESIRGLGFKAPLAVIPNGVDLPEAIPAPPRALRGVPLEGRRWLLFLGRVHPKKGLPLLVDAFAKVRSERAAGAEDWGLLIAGPDQLGHRAALEGQARARGLEETLRFVGPLHGPEKEQAFAASSAFVLPSHSEGSPVAALEALARSVPVVLSRACHLDEAAAAGAGWCDDDTVEGTARMLRLLLAAAPSELRARGARGRALVEERFTWRRVADLTRSVYEWLVGGGERPDAVLPP